MLHYLWDMKISMMAKVTVVMIRRGRKDMEVTVAMIRRGRKDMVWVPLS
jgi:hypothetical protein